MCHTIRRGSSERLLLLHARTAGDRSDLTDAVGLSASMHGAAAAYIREGGTEAVAIPLREGRPGEHRAGGFVEVDRELLPGVYQLGLPDEMLGEGAETVTLVLRFPGASIDPIQIDLVAYDPQDPDRLGMAALGPQGRIDALRGAFPRLTARELEEDMARKESV
jgi:hypothetical protein